MEQEAAERHDITESRSSGRQIHTVFIKLHLKKKLDFEGIHLHLSRSRLLDTAAPGTSDPTRLMTRAKPINNNQSEHRFITCIFKPCVCARVKGETRSLKCELMRKRL